MCKNVFARLSPQGVSAGLMMSGPESLTVISDTLVHGPFSDLFPLLYLGVGVYTIGSFYQIACCRLVGPGVYASFSSVRIAIAVISSYVWLGEEIESIFVWMGLFTVSAVVAWYTTAMITWGKERAEEILLSRNSTLDDDEITSCSAASVDTPSIIYEKVLGDLKPQYYHGQAEHYSHGESSSNRRKSLQSKDVYVRF